jgi:hypothetical protein
VVLAVGFISTGWWLVADTLHQRRRIQTAAETRSTGDLNHPAHLFCGQIGAVTVAELLEKAAQQGEGTRLNWPEVDPDDAELIRPYAQDLFPTAILPRVEG